MDFVPSLRQVIQDAPVPKSRVLQAEQRAASERLDRLSEGNSRRFEKAGECFPLLQDDINRPFEAVDQQTLTISKTPASLDGKMDVLLDHVLDVTDMSRLSGRVEAREGQVAEMAHRP